MIKRILFSLLFLGLSACAIQPDRQAHLDTDVIFNLPNNPWTGKPMTAQQQISLEYGGKVQHLQAIVDLKPGAAKILLIDMTGRRAVVIDWTSQKLDTVQADWLPQTVRAEEILARLVLAFWPVEVVKKGLTPDVSLQISDNTRRVMSQHQAVITITTDADDPWNAKTVIEHRNSDFRLTVSSSSRGAV